MDDEREAQDAREVLDRIGDILMVLSDVACGDFHTRCPKDLPDTHPLGALFIGINQMVDALELERKRSLAYQQELLDEKLATIERQRAEILRLSAPIIEVWTGVLCLVIVGRLDDSRSSQITEALLKEIVDKRVRCTIIDITGLEGMDSATTDHFLGVARAVRLLGAECMITGISPVIAQAIVNIGADMSGIVVHMTLRDALQHFIRGREEPGVGTVLSTTQPRVQRR